MRILSGITRMRSSAGPLVAPLLCAAALAGGLVDVAAQSPQFDAMARAYSSLASGRFEEAEAIARDMQARDAGDHGAATVAVLAAVPRGSEAALAAYERWLATTSHEDAFLLEPIARSVLATAANGPAGPARDRAAGLVQSSSATAAPDDKAVRGRALVAELSGGARNRALVLRQLGALGYQDAAPEVLRLLGDPSPDIRAAAAETLGQLGAAAAVPALQAALKDRAPEVRTAAAVALHRLGDAAGADLLGLMLSSDTPDLQLQAAQAMAGDPSDTWVPIVERLLDAEAPMTRLSAARLLLDVDPRRAEAAIAALLDHENPVVAAETASALTSSGVSHLPTLRRMLRHPLPAVRVEGAGALLRLVGRVP